MDNLDRSVTSHCTSGSCSASHHGATSIARSSLNRCNSSASMGMRSTEFLDMHNIDISRNHGHGTVPVPGRESHTADLAEFDRYISIMENVDRSELDMPLWNDEGGDHDDIDSDEGKGGMGEDEEEQDDHIGMAINTSPSKSSLEEETVPLNDIGSEEKGDTPEDDERTEQYPFNVKFWAYIRGILSNAKPVGFNELPNPNETSIKGPEDANKFLSKVISIGLLNPIQPAAIAQEGGFDEEDVLAELFYGTLCGLVAMRFAPECIQCGSAVMDTDMLGNVPAKALCGGCNTPNVIDSMDNIKVMFLLNSDVLYVLAENYACTPSSESMSHTSVFAAVPANSTGSGYSYSVGTGEETQIAPQLEAGKYRMHCPVAKTDNYLVVKRDATEKDKTVQLNMKVSDLVHSPHHGERKTLEVSHGKIQFDIFPDTRSFFVLWIQKDVEEKKLFNLPQEERSPFTTATRVIHHPIFNALFQDKQVVSVQQNVFLSVSNVVLVFTDIVDSTKLYASLGDGLAFRLVRKHFQVLFGAFTRNGGRVVKTIGDAVMASFTTGRAALTAVSEAMEMLPQIGRRPDNNNYLEIRVGIHSGQATIVPLNGVNDYFGMTANIAARVQSVAKASECFVTENVLETQDAKDAYTELTSKGTAFKATPKTQLKNLKGVEDEIFARGFRWTLRSRRDSELSSSTNSFASYMNRKGKTLQRMSILSIDSVGEEEDDDDENVPKSFERPAEVGRRLSGLLPIDSKEEDM